ncbi:Copper transport protein family [Hibiscus syriacus]|uniref:Copper transport protein family n=1 Tax=Hibiscus syriacus TaxID=106335 RepID=A0A6A3CZP1_HIBSY|nr:Copper transport protein family [Hibiscus syriacus]
MWKGLSIGSVFDEIRDDCAGYGSDFEARFTARKGFLESGRDDARRILEVLERDGQRFDVKVAISELRVRISGFLVREVLNGILKTINYANKTREDQFHRLLDEMALDLLNHMKEEGLSPGVLYFTTLIDGMSRAGNTDSCKYFFDEMIKNGFMPDVVCYTRMYVTMEGELGLIGDDLGENRGKELRKEQPRLWEIQEKLGIEGDLGFEHLPEKGMNEARNMDRSGMGNKDPRDDVLIVGPVTFDPTVLISHG